MAVYTTVTADDIEALLRDYDLGPYVAHEGIVDGVENSNYRLDTGSGRYILTLYERRVRADDLPFFLGLMDHLAARGLPCPVPVHGRDGAALRTLAGRPAAIVSFLEGRWPRRITPERCRALGGVLARLHAAGEGFGLERPNALSIEAWRPLFAACRASPGTIDPDLAAAIEAALARLERAWPRGLARGVIHADLFPDNAFFERERVSGIIDFYFACNDILAYDLAVCLNSWTFEPSGEFNLTKARAMIDGYAAARPLPESERRALPLLCQGAALRFLLTRLYDHLNRVEGAQVKVKDPGEYARKLRFFVEDGLDAFA
ncbi:MAG: homoserine kinase [Geminicoccaceae bacterium]|nr:homoserine kinase [Geminicoccaceae bacterium]